VAHLPLFGSPGHLVDGSRRGGRPRVWERRPLSVRIKGGVELSHLVYFY